MEDLLKMDVAYMVTDLRNIFDDKEEFETFADVMKESLGEILMELYLSDEETLTVETVFGRLKEIVNRRMDEA